MLKVQSAVMVRVVTVAADVNRDQDGGSPQAAKVAPEGFVSCDGWPWTGTAENAIKNKKQSRICLTEAGMAGFIETSLPKGIHPSAEYAGGGDSF